jgi:adenine-specific DNA-methyltransferase
MIDRRYGESHSKSSANGCLPSTIEVPATDTIVSSGWPEEVHSREHCLIAIQKAIDSRLVYSSSTACVAEGDSLECLRLMPSHSVSLILTDPPYHATKKHNIFGDKAFAQDQHYLEWIALYAQEWRRVLKLNGSLFCFCDTSMAARLDVLLSQNFNMLSHVVWTKPNDPGYDGWKGKMKKEALRQWYAHSERILFAEPAMEGSLFRSPFAKLLSEARKRTGMSMYEVTAKIGAHGKVNHGGAVSNWEAGRNTPSREQYDKMVEVFLATGKVKYMPPYEDAIRVFTIDKTKEFTDVWTFPSVRPYPGKHPAEKPIDLLEHAIGAATTPGDIVLDCFAGSGSTAIAAINLGRRAVALEIEPQWVERITARIESHIAPTGESSAPIGRRIKKSNGQLTLFK